MAYLANFMTAAMARQGMRKRELRDECELYSHEDGKKESSLLHCSLSATQSMLVTLSTGAIPRSSRLLPSDMCTNRAPTWRESSFAQTSYHARCTVCLAVPCHPHLITQRVRIIARRYIGRQLTIYIPGCSLVPPRTVRVHFRDAAVKSWRRCNPLKRRSFWLK
jgi:hypothetical protein